MSYFGVARTLPRPLTYRDLYHEALAAAGGLIERGVSPAIALQIMLQGRSSC